MMLIKSFYFHSIKLFKLLQIRICLVYITLSSVQTRFQHSTYFPLPSFSQIYLHLLSFPFPSHIHSIDPSSPLSVLLPSPHFPSYPFPSLSLHCPLFPSLPIPSPPFPSFPWGVYLGEECILELTIIWHVQFTRSLLLRFGLLNMRGVKGGGV